MKLIREYLGGREVIDLDTPEGRHDWVHLVCQDEEWAAELEARIRTEGEVVINEGDPLYIERYTAERDTR